MDEFREKRKNNKRFTRKDAERWFREAVIAYITTTEDKKLTKLYGNKKCRPASAYKVAKIKLVNIKF